MARNNMALYMLTSCRPRVFASLQNRDAVPIPLCVLINTQLEDFCLLVMTYADL